MHSTNVVTTSRRRRNVVVVSLIVLFTLSVFLGLFLIGYGFVLSTLFMVLMFAVAAGFHYVVWGRREEQLTHAHFDNVRYSPKR